VGTLTRKCKNAKNSKSPWLLGSSSSSTFEEKKQRDNDELGRLTIICYTREKKQINDNKPRRLAVIYYT